ncbi:hypothetical protein [Streptomyces sp. NPDC050287]|uniref:hypothetical protein n=1 Tax=Streptomyces sp. NPDC050287 TaxID=3365608 RepID=UPI003787C5ED
MSAGLEAAPAKDTRGRTGPAWPTLSESSACVAVALSGAFAPLNVAELCATAPEPDVRRISLNFPHVPLGPRGGRPQRPMRRRRPRPVLRLRRMLLLFFARWWRLEPLYRSNAP